MTRYLLDTSALIDFSKGREPATSLVLQLITEGDDVGVCAVNVAEFSAGLPPEARQQWRDFLMAVSYWDAGQAVAQQAGTWRYQFAVRGTPLSTADVLIAAVAHEQRATSSPATSRIFRCWRSRCIRRRIDLQPENPLIQVPRGTVDRRHAPATLKNGDPVRKTFPINKCPAFFLPGMVDLAGAVGTQTETRVSSSHPRLRPALVEL